MFVVIEFTSYASYKCEYLQIVIGNPLCRECNFIQRVNYIIIIIIITVDILIYICMAVIKFSVVWLTISAFT